MSHTDWGVYKCKAHNNMGMGEAIVVLKSKLDFRISNPMVH